MSVLVDTSVIVDLIRSRPPALAWLARSRPRPLWISSITAFELSRGIEDEADARDVDEVLDHFAPIAIDAPIAARAGAIHRRFAPSHGLDIGDAIIAATALAERLPLVTLNAKHFPMLKRVQKPY